MGIKENAREDGKKKTSMASSKDLGEKSPTTKLRQNFDVH